MIQTYKAVKMMEYLQYEGCSINTGTIAITQKHVGNSFLNLYMFLLKNSLIEKKQVLLD